MFLGSFIVLAFNAGEAGIATPYVDPVTKLPAQDEAAYAHMSTRMATNGDWLTPTFLGRYAFLKPPLLNWLSAISMNTFGYSAFALRVPSILAGALTATLLFLVLGRARGLLVALAAVLLLCGNSIFHTLSRIAITDALLGLFITAALLVIIRDPRMSSPATPVSFGIATGFAVMAKAAAGGIPIVALILWSVAGGRENRPTLSRAIQAIAIAVAIALPWHLYQLATHPRWFWNEYVLREHLSIGVGDPVQTSTENHLMFYLRRLFLADPVLCAAALIAIPGLVKAWRARVIEVRVTSAWIAAVVVALFAFRYRAAWFLMPLIPAVVFGITLVLGKTQKLFCGLAVAILAAAFAVKVAHPEQPWALVYGAQSELPTADALERYCEVSRGNPLFIVEPEDQFYSAVLPLNRVRYVYIQREPNTRREPIDFGYLGITLTTDRFLELDRWRPIYSQRLREWGLQSDDPIATVVLARSEVDIAAIVRNQPESDFLLPVRYSVATESHAVKMAAPGFLWLLSKTPLPNPYRSRTLPCRFTTPT